MTDSKCLAAERHALAEMMQGRPDPRPRCEAQRKNYHDETVWEPFPCGVLLVEDGPCPLAAHHIPANELAKIYSERSVNSPTPTPVNVSEPLFYNDPDVIAFYEANRKTLTPWDRLHVGEQYRWVCRFKDRKEDAMATQTLNENPRREQPTPTYREKVIAYYEATPAAESRSWWALSPLEQAKWSRAYRGSRSGEEAEAPEPAPAPSSERFQEQLHAVETWEPKASAVVNRAALDKIIEKTFLAIEQLNGTKGNEYASNEDALANFKRRAADLGLSPMQVWGIFAGKHYDSIMAYIRRGHTLSEPIEGRIDDLVLYLILLKGLIQEATGLSAAIPSQRTAEDFHGEAA